MSTVTQEKKDAVDVDSLNDLERALHRDYTEDLRSHDDAVQDYDAFEAMEMSKTYDAVSRQTNSGLTDSMTSTIYLERAARVAGQLPDGVMVAFGKRDFGKALFMDILRTKWIYKNANAQRKFRTKMFMWQYASSEYGWAPMYYDLNVSPSGYFGPDCWLWNPRNFIPQTGFTTISDMDYVHAIAYKSPGWFEDLLDEESENKELNKKSGWDFAEIRSIKEQVKNKTRMADPSRDTKTVRDRQLQSMRQVAVVTRYEAGRGGRWISFLPDFGYKVIRSIKNPHRNGRIPFVIKPCIPKFDSFYNLGDFQRSMPMQFANDGLDNFYFQGIKINLFPPIIINSNSVVRHTIRPGEAGSVWEETESNGIRRLETSTAGLATYQNAKGMAKGAVQSIAGTTDTRANAENASDPGFGKTPEALRMMSDREGTRDGQDRDFLEDAMQELLDGMMSLIPTITEHIPIDLLAKDIEEIMQSGYPDVAEIFKGSKERGFVKFRFSESKKQMRIKIDPSKLRGLEYRFEIEPNSTAKKTKEGQLAGMVDFMNLIGKIPNALQEYRDQTGRVLNWDAFFKKYGQLSDIPGLDQLFMDGKPVEPVQPEPTATGAPTAPLEPEQLMAEQEALRMATGGQPAPAMPAVPPMGMPMAPTAPPPPIEAPMPPQDDLIVAGYRFATPEGAEHARNILRELAASLPPQ